MALFGKREKAYEVWGDKPRWKEARQRLKDAGIKVMETGFYETEAPACGCGAKLDHRDFGPNGKIARLTASGWRGCSLRQTNAAWVLAGRCWNVPCGITAPGS